MNFTSLCCVPGYLNFQAFPCNLLPEPTPILSVNYLLIPHKCISWPVLKLFLSLYGIHSHS
jgi:hypothetical protein